MAMVAGDLSLLYSEAPGRESPKTTIVITVCKREVLSHRSPRGDAVCSTIKLPSEQPIGRISKTFDLDIRYFRYLPAGETLMKIAVLFCEVGTYESPEYLLMRARQLAEFLNKKALELIQGRLNAVNAVVSYQYSVYGLQLVELELGVASQVAGTDGPVMNPPAQVMMFDRREPNMPICWLCFLDFDHGAMVSQLPCRHIFHLTCLDGWSKKFNLCPFCCCWYPPTQAARGSGVDRPSSSGRG